MLKYLIILPVIFPVIFAIPVMVIPFKKLSHMYCYTEIIVLINTAIVFYLLTHNPGEVTLITFSQYITFTLKIDGLGMVFSGLVSVLWPLATLYAFEYMSHEKRKHCFFLFYTMTFGVTVGVAFAGNILTMYFFYEMLTLVTVPLVIHTYTREAVLAARKYVYYSMGGAALGFLAVVFVITYSHGEGFTYGGILDYNAMALGNHMFLLIYVLSFMGFSVKAAMFPFYSWIPDAGIAPTPVTALLHAVAVVKAGAFAVIRITYYCFGTKHLSGTWAQYFVMGLAVFTIVFGCSMALKETHLKRRLAFSTVANLSYIIFGATLMTPAGLLGGLSHLVFHAVMKICAFFCVGAIMHQTGKHYVHETTGFGLKMPLVYLAFTVSTLGIMGVPGTCGFISKWYLAIGALSQGSAMAVLGIGALLISALLTAIYLMSIVVRGYFPDNEFDLNSISYVKDPSWKMILPLMCFSAAVLFLGFKSGLLINFLSDVAKGTI